MFAYMINPYINHTLLDASFSKTHLNHLINPMLECMVYELESAQTVAPLHACMREPWHIATVRLLAFIIKYWNLNRMKDSYMSTHTCARSMAHAVMHIIYGGLVVIDAANIEGSLLVVCRAALIPCLYLPFRSKDDGLPRNWLIGIMFRMPDHSSQWLFRN